MPSTRPQTPGEGAADMIARKFPLVDHRDRPIPTNKLWTHLLDGKATGSLWMYPWRVDPRESGLELHFPIKWLASGSDPQCDAPLRVGGEGFKSHGLLVKDWGDWTLSFRLPAKRLAVSGCYGRRGHANCLGRVPRRTACPRCRP